MNDQQKWQQPDGLSFLDFERLDPRRSLADYNYTE
jgi:hypothetical protein